MSGTIYAAKGQLKVSGNGCINGGGDSVHRVGSQFIGSTMGISGNGKVRLDARAFNSLPLTANLFPAPLTLPDGTLVTSARNSTVTGRTAPLATVALETNGDSLFDEGTTTADALGNYTLPVTLTQGTNTLRVRASANGQQTIQSIQVIVRSITFLSKHS